MFAGNVAHFIWSRGTMSSISQYPQASMFLPSRHLRYAPEIESLNAVIKTTRILPSTRVLSDQEATNDVPSISICTPRRSIPPRLNKRQGLPGSHQGGQHQKRGCNCRSRQQRSSYSCDRIPDQPTQDSHHSSTFAPFAHNLQSRNFGVEDHEPRCPVKPRC